VEVPIRTCVACRQAAAKPSLVRLVAIDGAVHVDPRGRLQARGAYVHATQECAEIATQREGAAVARALRTARAAIDATRLRTALVDEIAGRRMRSTMAHAGRDDKVTARPSAGVCT
jgi:uncharacterized protein